ncbi:MAG TPA: redoxin domain-containing protein [Cytophagales bacterium]|nr:redoxin domain-containing protein [Cytophagales bacterium]
MKFSRILALMLAFYATGAYAQKKADAYKLSFKVRGIHDTVCFLANYYGDKQYLKDTAVCDSKGNFTFTGTSKLPGGVYLVVLPKKNYFEILIPNDKEQFFSAETDTTNFVTSMKITGSPENILFYDYLNYIAAKSQEVEVLRKDIKAHPKDSAANTQKMITIDKDVVAYRKDLISKNPQTFVSKLFKASEEIDIPQNPNPKDSLFAYRYYKKHYFDNIDMKDDRMLRTPVFHGKLDKYIKKMVLQTPDSLIPEIDKIIKMTGGNKEMFKYCVWYLNYTYETSQLMGMDAIFVHMAKKYYMDSTKVDWIDKNTRDKFKEKYDILKNLLIGMKAPNAYLADSNGTYVQLHSLKAKATVMIFWDPNCGHCQKEVPKFHDLYVAKGWKKKGIAVYSVSIDREEKDWKKFLREKKISSFINVWDKYTHTDFRKMWDIYSTPVIYILDENLIIRAKRLGVDQLEEFLTNGLKVL